MKSQCTHNLGRHCAGRTAWTSQFLLAATAALLLGSSCGAQNIDANAQRPALSSADRNKVIYVKDFDLDPENFKQDKGGVTGKGYLLPRPPGSLLRRKRQDPASAANSLIRLMSESLVADLQKAGLKARRWSGSEPIPTDGLIMSGVFTELDEGNQMRRALLGFGSGRSKMQLYVMVTNAEHGGQPLYETSPKKSNGKTPGSVIAIDPYIGAAGFVAKFGMTKNAPEKMVKNTAAKITTEFAKALNVDSTAGAVQVASKH